MNHAFGVLPALAQIAPVVEVAEWASAEVGLSVAVVLTFSGMWMHWNLPYRRMSLEERMKDGKVSEDEARRRLRFHEICAPVVTGLGVALLLIAFLRWSR